MRDLAAMAADIFGRPVARDVVSDKDKRAGAQKNGVPDAVLAIMMGYYHAARAGEFAGTDQTLERLLGRPPRSMRSVMEKALTGDA